MITRRARLLLLAALLGIGPGPAASQTATVDTAAPALLDYQSIHHPVIARNGMVASQDRLATEVGVEVLKDGGNAVDAAVAVGFALAVTLPRAGNIAGGGFMLVHLADSGKTIAIDYKEKAPMRADRDMFLGNDGKVDRDRARLSHLSFGVPGTVAALADALERYGTMSLADVLAPAIRLAEEGFLVSDDLAYSFEFARDKLGDNAEARKIFFESDGTPLDFGDRLVQSELAWSLRQLADDGPDAFYRGAIAKRIVSEMERHGGLVTMEDLSRFDAPERPVVRGTYRGYELVFMPPPSSGGVHIIQMLNVMAKFDISESGANTAKTAQIMVEAMRQAYADRAEFLGDPDFVDNPVAWLTSGAYAEETFQAITPGRARSSKEVGAGRRPPEESPDTTHFSVMDRFGNAVSNTYSLNFSYGSGKVIAGTGILMNNVMDDFSANPGEPNAYGLIGGEANAIQPGKRALSSMTPTIVLREGKPFLVTGSPGGSTIITSVLQQIVNVIDHDMNVLESIVQPRFHHQWQPDVVFVEPGFGVDTRVLLEDMGYDVQQRGGTLGSLQAIMWRDGIFYGGADPRRPGASALGY